MKIYFEVRSSHKLLSFFYTDAFHIVKLIFHFVYALSFVLYHIIVDFTTQDTIRALNFNLSFWIMMGRHLITLI